MDINLFKKQNKYFANILLYLTLSVTLTIFIVSIVLYINFDGIGRSLVYSYSKDSLHQVSYSATFMTDTVKSLATQIYFNTDTSKLLYDPAPGSEEINIALNRLNSYRTTMPLVHSIYLYNGDAGILYSNLNGNMIKGETLFFDQEILKILNHFDNDLRLKPIVRKLSESYLSADKDLYSNIYTFVFYDIPVKDGKVRKAVILNISEEWMRKTVSALDTSPGSNTFIVDRNGLTVCGNRKDVMLSDISEEKYIRSILKSSSPSGYSVEEVEGVRSLVTYVSSDPLGWKYIRITPYDNVLKKIDDIKRNTILLCLIILFIGLLFSYISSRTMYKPIEKIIHNLDSLAEEKRNNFFPLKQEFLRGLLRRSNLDTPHAVKSIFGNYDIKLDLELGIALILLKIDHFTDFCSKYNFEDRNLLKFGIMNIASELCGEKFTNEAIDMDDDHIVLVLNLPPEISDEVHENLEQIAGRILENAEKYLDISLSAAVSVKEGCRFNHLNDLYHEVLEASQYRLFFGHHSIISTERVYEFKFEGYEYPTQKEKLLIEALMLRKLEKVKELYLEIISGLTGYTFRIFNSAILRLVFSINVAMDHVEKNSGIPSSYNFNAFIADLNSLETVQSINSKFFELFSYIAEKLEDRKSSRYDVLVNKIIAMVHAQYTDINLSLETIADHFNMSSVYLGRLFKKNTSKSVSDYINEVRIEKSKELLEKSSATISEIVEKTGFSSSNYFYTYFKKTNGVTPNEYRQKLGTAENNYN